MEKSMKLPWPVIKEHAPDYADSIADRYATQHHDDIQKYIGGLSYTGGDFYDGKVGIDEARKYIDWLHDNGKLEPFSMSVISEDVSNVHDIPSTKKELIAYTSNKYGLDKGKDLANLFRRYKSIPEPLPEEVLSNIAYDKDGNVADDIVAWSDFPFDDESELSEEDDEYTPHYDISALEGDAYKAEMYNRYGELGIPDIEEYRPYYKKFYGDNGKWNNNGGRLNENVLNALKDRL